MQNCTLNQTVHRVDCRNVNTIHQLETSDNITETAWKRLAIINDLGSTFTVAGNYNLLISIPIVYVAPP